MWCWLASLYCMAGIVSGFSTSDAFPAKQHRTRQPQCLAPEVVSQPRSIGLFMVPPSSARENEIRRKIRKLKQQGKIQKGSPSSEEQDQRSYQAKIQSKLGKSKSKLLGFTSEDDDDFDEIQQELDAIDDDDESSGGEETSPRGRIGSLPQTEPTSTVSPPEPASTSSSSPRLTIDPSLFEDPSEPQKEEMSEEELLELVSAKLAEKRRLEREVEEAERAERIRKLQEEQLKQKSSQAAAAESSIAPEKTTTGVGGSWQKPAEEKEDDLYQPKSGSWGAFPRPRNISTAYGGGRRVGAGYSKEDDAASEMKTKELLQQYRRKVGIDVPTEKEHAAQIEEALRIAQYAMQRGVYATAVSALEKITKWCSTNSPVGSKVFLELAMAYEATGRTQEAYQVYKTLSNCRMEDVKFNAKRLLYGLEAMEFMRDVSSEFSRQKIKNTFIDTTGLRDIASNFDDVYNTAYIDLESGYYKRLTESVVRSNREARQILLKAKGKDEVPRMKIVQALRSMARHFDDALEAENLAAKKQEPTAYINGQPLIANRPSTATTVAQLDEFVLASPQQMMENLDGSWELQLLADKTGDGVSYFNTTFAVQEFSTAKMTFEATGPSGFTKVQCSGTLTMDDSKRVLERTDVKTEGASGNFLGMFGSNKDSGFLAAVSKNQQIISVDSMLLITKAPTGTRKGNGADKEYFAVW
eukprot:CAMPEP_0176019980 /NCGR_PEP_ID=MMETSP0120_2-20121206/9667_1 /TAXON_ID=160619 /ORGANISM="Kryptoperidinium foliaceum, Strain CCMP 1326" /LENGTH=695 /DNA_ID=CAMNT_0017353067 /DNA_START=394 /DNA_END=2478 /DNA_ORIENTATION=+